MAVRRVFTLVVGTYLQQHLQCISSIKPFQNVTLNLFQGLVSMLS